MSDQLKSIVFALVVAVICSLLLTAASSGLKGRQLRNVEIDKQKNILKSVGLLDSRKKYSHQEISALYSETILPSAADKNGHLREGTSTVEEGEVPVYLYKKDKMISAYVIPVISKGLWGKIYGYMALENDGATLLGFTVYRHNETPGLGGEIEKDWFQQNFRGKKIVDENGLFSPVSIAKGKAADKVSAQKLIHYVDGISGATLTGKFLSEGLKNVLQTYEPVSKGFRNN